MHARRVVCALLVIVFVALAAPVSALAEEEGWWAYTGTVRDADSGDPLPYACVSLKKEAPGTDPEIYAAVTDSEGRFQIPPYAVMENSWFEIWGVSTYVVVSRVGWDYAKSGASTWDWRSIDLGTFTLQRDPAVIPHQVIFGQDRFETSVRISQAIYPDGLDGAEGVVTTGTVVVASGETWADALVAASVAGVEHAPILLTTQYGYSYNYWGPWGYYDTSSVVAEVRRLKPERAIIVGGDEAISPTVEEDLNIWVGTDDVVRLAGATRYETAQLAAAYVADRAPAGDRTALVSSASSFADALAASPVSWADQLPLYLSSATGLHPSMLDSMVTDGITDVIILGGEAAVPASTEASLVAQFGDANVERIGGSNRYQTSMLLADWSVGDHGFDYTNPAIVSGERYPDALSGGPYQGSTRSVMLLTRTARLEGVVETALLANAAEIEEVRFFGGPAAVSSSVRHEIDMLLR